MLGEIKEILEEELKFNYLGRGNNLGIWATYKKGDEEYDGMIDLKKDIGGKGYGTVRLFIFGSTEQGVEIKIEIYLASYCEYYTFFEGFVETIGEFNTILKCLGIK